MNEIECLLTGPSISACPDSNCGRHPDANRAGATRGHDRQVPAQVPPQDAIRSSGEKELKLV